VIDGGVRASDKRSVLITLIVIQVDFAQARTSPLCEHGGVRGTTAPPYGQGGVGVATIEELSPERRPVPLGLIGSGGVGGG
jgi:hypothetical protein